MKLTNRTEMKKFIETIRACHNDVFMRANNKLMNLKEDPGLYWGVDRLAEENNDAEIFTNCREDEARMIGFLYELEHVNCVSMVF